MLNKVLQFGADYTAKTQLALILICIRRKYTTIAIQRYQAHPKRLCSLRERVVQNLKITGFFSMKKNPLGTG